MSSPCTMVTSRESPFSSIDAKPSAASSPASFCVPFLRLPARENEPSATPLVFAFCFLSNFSIRNHQPCYFISLRAHFAHFKLRVYARDAGIFYAKFAEERNHKGAAKAEFFKKGHKGKNIKHVIRALKLRVHLRHLRVRKPKAHKGAHKGFAVKLQIHFTTPKPHGKKRLLAVYFAKHESA